MCATFLPYFCFVSSLCSSYHKSENTFGFTFLWYLSNKSVIVTDQVYTNNCDMFIILTLWQVLQTTLYTHSSNNKICTRKRNRQIDHETAKFFSHWQYKSRYTGNLNKEIIDEIEANKTLQKGNLYYNFPFSCYIISYHVIRKIAWYMCSGREAWRILNQDWFNDHNMWLQNA